MRPDLLSKTAAGSPYDCVAVRAGAEPWVERCTREIGSLAQPLAFVEATKRIVKLAGQPSKTTLKVGVCSIQHQTVQLFTTAIVLSTNEEPQA